MCLATSPPSLSLSYDVFSGNHEDRKIYVPCASVDNYKLATNWTYYASAIIGSPILNHAIDITSNNEKYSTVEVGELDCDSNVVISAVPAAAHLYQFYSWSDGGTSNPRTMHITSDTSLTALFGDRY